MSSFRSAARGLLAVALLTLAAGCGGADAPGTGPVAAADLRLSDSTATSMTMLVAHLRDGGASAATVTALVDTTATPVAVIDDSTVAVPVPALPAGRYQLTLRVGARTVTAPLHVAAAPGVPDAAAYVDSVFTGVEQALARQAALVADPATRPSGIDSAAYVNGVTAARDAFAGFRSEFAALSADEQRRFATALRANDRALGITTMLAGEPAGTAPGGFAMPSDAMMSASVQSQGACLGGQACVDVIFQFVEFARDVTIAYLGVTGMVEVGSWFAGPAGRLFAKVAKVGLSAGWLYFQLTELTDHLNRPASVDAIVAAFKRQFGMELRVDGAALQTTGPLLAMRAGTEQALTVRGEYRIIVAGDAATMPAVARVQGALTRLRAVWNRVASGIPGFSLPSPALGSAPRLRVEDEILPQFLQAGAVSLTGATAKARASGDAFAVTIENPRQGDDHVTSLQLRYVAPGMATRAMSVPVRLYPERYRVMTLGILPETATVRKGGTRQFERVPRDSSGDVIHDSLLVGRATSWTSSRNGKATVSLTGLVTGVDTGTVVISATLDGKRADRTTRVGGSLVVNFYKAGFDPSPDRTDLGNGWYRYSCSPTYSFQAYDPNGFVNDPPYVRVIGYDYRMTTGNDALLIQERKDIPVDQQWELNGERMFTMTWYWDARQVTYFKVYVTLRYRDLRDGLVYTSPEAYDPGGFVNDPPYVRVIGYDYRMTTGDGTLLIQERKDIPVDQQWELNGGRMFTMTWYWDARQVTYFKVYVTLRYRDLRDGQVYSSPEAYEFCQG